MVKLQQIHPAQVGALVASVPGDVMYVLTTLCDITCQHQPIQPVQVGLLQFLALTRLCRLRSISVERNSLVTY